MANSPASRRRNQQRKRKQATLRRSRSSTDVQQNTERAPQTRSRSQSQGGLARNKDIIVNRPPAAPRERRASLSDIRRSRPNGASANRARRNSISEQTVTRDRASVNITFGRKIPDTLLGEDVETVYNRVGPTFTTKDVLEKLAQDFEVSLDLNDTEAQIVEKLKTARVINQEDYDSLTRRQISDQLLRNDIVQVRAQGIEQEFSAKAVLEHLARNFEVSIESDNTEQELLGKLKRDRMINQADYDFIVANISPETHILRNEARRKADEMATAIIESQVAALENEAEQRKENIRIVKKAEALKNLSSKHTKNLEQPKNSPKYRQAITALNREIENRSQADIEQINGDLARERTRLNTDELAAKKQELHRNFSDFLNRTDYHPFSFNALDVSTRFEDAAELVELVKRKPNIQVLVTPQHYTLLQNCLRVLGEETTSAILNRITPTVLSQFNTSGDENAGLVLLNEAHATEDLADGKLRDLGAHIQDVLPLVESDSAKRNLADLLVNDNLADILALTDSLTKFAIGQRMDTLHTLRPHAANPTALLAGIQLANRLNWSAQNIHATITGLPLNSDVAAVRAALYDAAMGMFDKNSHFSAWIKSLNVLLEEAGYTLEIESSFALSGGNTLERICRISDNHGDGVDNFVIHYHPGASKASVNSPYSSGKHIKPVRGNKDTPRLYWDGSIPDKLKSRLPTKP